MIRQLLILTTIIFIFAVGFGIGQDKTPNSLENGKKTDSAASVNQLFLAYQSAKYGREKGSPDALIFAASILKRVPSDKILLDKEIEGGRPDEISKESKPNQTAEAFLNDAKVLAKKDKFLLGRIATVGKIVPDTRGAAGGPKRASTEVKSYATDVITLQFKGGENAVVAISGDGDTDLDLYVYDENGHLIASDTGGSDDCRVRFFPKWNGVFKIKVKNLGNVYNRYILTTN